MQAKLNPALETTLRRIRVVPVLTVEDPASAPGLVRALVAGGLPAIEVTLRTPAALQVIRAMVEAEPGALVGAGTVLDPDQATAAIEAGARFVVSPGMTPRLIEAAEKWRVPFLPGAATASEVMALQDLGYRFLKFFPAEPAGGLAYLRALSAPLRGISFCPTGGVDARNASAYLAEPCISCVGGSWVAPTKSIAAGDWSGIERLATEARGMAGKAA